MKGWRTTAFCVLERILGVDTRAKEQEERGSESQDGLFLFLPLFLSSTHSHTHIQTVSFFLCLPLSFVPSSISVRTLRFACHIHVDLRLANRVILPEWWRVWLGDRARQGLRDVPVLSLGSFAQGTFAALLPSHFSLPISSTLSYLAASLLQKHILAPVFFDFNCIYL